MIFDSSIQALKAQKDAPIVQGYLFVKDLYYGSASDVYRIKRISNAILEPNFYYRQISIKDSLKKLPEKQNMSEKVIYRFPHYNTKVPKVAQQQETHCKQNEVMQQDQFFSVKLYNLKKIHSSSNEQMKKNCRYNILTEILLYSKLNHQGITKALTIYSQYKKIPQQNLELEKLQKNQLLQKLGIILESNSKGHLLAFMSYIQRTKILKDNKLRIIKFYAAQIVNSLSYLNERMQILHRDVKAENIMINKHFELKIIDFGSALITQSFLDKVSQKQLALLKALVFQNESNCFKPQSKKDLVNDLLKNRLKLKVLVGSKHYISPQMIQNTKNQMFFVQNAYKKTDIWSFGVLLYKIFHDKFPFQHKNQKALLQMIQNQEIMCEIDKNLPQQVKEILQKTLKKDYTQRATWDDIKSFSFFHGLNIEKIYQQNSPIYQLLQQDKKLTEQCLKKYEFIHFQQELIVQSKNSKKTRKVLIVTQKINSQNVNVEKVIILKLNNSISQEIVIRWGNSENQTQKSQKIQQFFIQGQRLVLVKQNQIYKFQALEGQKTSKSAQETQKNQFRSANMQGKRNVIQLMMDILKKLTGK